VRVGSRRHVVHIRQFRMRDSQAPPHLSPLRLQNHRPWDRGGRNVLLLRALRAREWRQPGSGSRVTKPEDTMPRYGRAASKRVESAMRRRKSGTLRSGKGGKGGRVKSRKQAIAIGLSEARKKGAKVPRRRS